jgi:hypothetical protein
MECSSVFRYVTLLVLYILAFVCMMMVNLELIGFGLMFVVNLLTSYFIIADVMDLSDSFMKYDIFLGVLFTGLALNMISISLVVMCLAGLHSKYKKNNTPIQMSPQNRYILNNFKIVFFTNVLTILTMTMLFFLGKPGVSFYNYAFDKNTAFREMFFFIIKIIFTFGSLGMSVYLAYTANIASNILKRQLDVRNLR